MITVRVLDRYNRPVDAIAVTITSTYHNQDTATATTNQQGIAKFKLHPNEYSIFIDGKFLKGVIWAPLAILCFMSRYCQ